MSKKKLSIIIPAFNEESCLPQLFDVLKHVITNQLQEWDTEVVLVDDHSSDNTPQIIRSRLKDFSWLHSIRLLKNSGSHIAIFAGLSVCHGDFAFIMGADLQDHPEIIPEFLKKTSDGFKIVLGERTTRHDPWLKRLPSSIFNYIMSHFVLKTFPVNGGDVFLIDRDIINAVLQCEEKNVNIFVLILSLCHDVGTVQYIRKVRFAGQSKWKLTQLLKLAYDSVITVGYIPVKVIFWSGITSFILAILVICYLAIAKLSGLIEVEGWASILAAIMAFGGLNMVAISVLGEYLWRNFDQTRKRPMFIIERHDRAVWQKKDDT